MRKTTISTAVAVLLLTVGGSGYAFAAGSDDPTGHERHATHHANHHANHRANHDANRLGDDGAHLGADDRGHHRGQHRGHHRGHAEARHHAGDRHVEAADDRGAHVEPGDDHGGRDGGHGSDD